MRRYTASVVGGGAGGRLSADALGASERYELVAIADVSAEVCAKLREAYPNARTFPSHREMFGRCPTEVVCVSTWAPSHKEITLDALDLPLSGLVVEKPLGDTARAGREILEEIKARNLPVAVPHGLLVADHAREILDLVHAEEIGSLVLVEVQCDKWDIINAGIHWLNFFVALVRNEPMDFVMAVCDSSTRTYRDGMQVETAGVTYVQTRSGVRFVMNTGDDVKITREGKGTLFRLVGTRGLVEFWGWEASYFVLNEREPAGKLVSVETRGGSAHQRHLDALAEQMDCGKPDYSVAESSLTALELCEGAYLSSRHRCKVTLPLADFKSPPAADWEPGRPYSGTGGGRDGRKLA